MAVLVCMAFSRACFAARRMASSEFLRSGFFACDKSRGFMVFSPVQGGRYIVGIIIQNPVIDCIAVVLVEILQTGRKTPADDAFRNIMAALIDSCCNTGDGSFH